MAGQLKVMNRRGHSTVTWSTDLQETVDNANRRFNELLAEGYTAFEMHDATTGEQITEFVSTAETIVMVPRMVAG